MTSPDLPMNCEQVQRQLLSALATARTTADAQALKEKLLGEAGLLPQFVNSGVGVDQARELSELVYARIRELESGRDEAHSADIVDWTRVRAGIEHENLLTNHRFTWLLTSQGFLVAAFVVVFQASASNEGAARQGLYRFLLAGLAVLGMLAAGYLIFGIRAAQTQHDRLKEWWRVLPKRHPDRHPPISGENFGWFTDRAAYHGFPVVFILAWVGWIAIVLWEPLRQYASTIGMALLIVVAALGLIYLGFLFGRNAKAKPTRPPDGSS